MPRSVVLELLNCGPVKFSGCTDALYERHLTFDQVVPVAAARPRDRFEAVAHSVRDPQWHYDKDPETHAALDLSAGNHVSPNEPGIFTPILDVLLRKGDYYLHLADLKSYSEAHTRLGELYRDQEPWSRTAVFNIAASSTFSSDRTIAEYARDIWHAEPCPVEQVNTP